MGKVVQVDATLIRADLAWESPGQRHADTVLGHNDAVCQQSDIRSLWIWDNERPDPWKKVCLTDPDATMATNASTRRIAPTHKQHTAVDDQFVVILNVEVSTGHANEGEHILAQVDAVANTTRSAIEMVTADQGHTYGKG